MRWFVVLTLLGLVWGGATRPLMADDPFAAPPGSPATPAPESEEHEATKRPDRSVAELIQEADAALKRATALKESLNPALPPAVPVADDSLRLIPEEAKLKHTYIGGGSAPAVYLSLWLWLVNPTDKDVTVRREDLRLVLPAATLKPGDPPEAMKNRFVPLGDSRKPVLEIPEDGEISIKPGKAVAIPVVFFDLPSEKPLSQMTLRLPHGDDTAEVDLKKIALGRMKLTIQRLGPKGILGVVTIGGSMNDIAVGSLVDVLRELVKTDTRRVVVSWTEDASDVSREILVWLANSVSQFRTGQLGGQNEQYPTLPSGLVDFRLTNVPNWSRNRSEMIQAIVDDTLGEAVAAALAEPFQAIPIETLRAEIVNGDPLTRPAAIAAGVRLPISDLPLLLEMTHDDDPEIARAAVVALQGFGTPEAIGRLMEIAKEGPKILQAAAIESLAASRYGDAHEALNKLLDAALGSGATISIDGLASVLARHPRALWRDTLFTLSLEGEGADRIEALMALANVGHPRMLDSLRSGLHSGDQKLEQRALELLIARSDPRSRRLALDYTLDYLRDHLPTLAMVNFLERVKEPQAAALLLAQLEGDRRETMNYVDLLAKIGGEAARQRIETVYPQVSPANRAKLLKLLTEMNSPRLLEFAQEALRSNHSTLKREGMRIFQEDGSRQAVAVLEQVLIESNHRENKEFAAKSLSEIGTPQACLALRQAWHRGGPLAVLMKSYYLNTRHAHSPGWDSFIRARDLAIDEQWEEARLSYSSAIEFDPSFIDAWSGRAQSNMRLDHREAAAADYRHVLELDSHDPAAITCLGILKVVRGDVEPGLKFVAARAEEFAENALFAYNSACLKSLASKPIAKTNPKRAEALRSEAVRDLERSFVLGMDAPSQVAWAREDPDLEQLHGREDYERVMKVAEAKLPEGEPP